MNTKLLLASSAFFLGLTGVGLTFFPKEILVILTIDPNQTLTIILQVLGSLYLGFGIMNWMAKGSIIGGIYNRPIAIGNFMQFGVGSLSLIKIVIGVQENAEIIIILTILYSIFAICFAYVFMVNPRKLTDEK
ncbi:MAG: hypothetical protein ABGW66_04865 [Flavobacteriaceae bacterium]|jgi:Fe2+ transport system protein B